MGEKTAVRAPDRRLVLHLALRAPVMTGFEHEGPAWKWFCFLDVHLGSTRRCTWSLPFEDGQVMNWERSLPFQMDCNWPHLSLGLEVQRRDYSSYMDAGRVVFRAGEAHTSDHTAVIGAAKVPLLDALVLGDDSDHDEGAEEKKRRLDREKAWNLVEGTRVFNGRVQLQGWRPPAPGDVDGEPANVVFGSVNLCMCLTEVVVENSDY